jgi:hypothetical protein
MLSSPIDSLSRAQSPSCHASFLSQISLLQKRVKAEAENKSRQKCANQIKNSSPKNVKTSSDSSALPVSHVIHTYSDDLESLFFIFTWVGIKFSGPNGAVCQERMSNSLLNCWTNLDLASCFTFKTTLVWTCFWVP